MIIRRINARPLRELATLTLAKDGANASIKSSTNTNSNVNTAPIVDVLGIAKHVGEIVTTADYDKRDLVLVDQSGVQVQNAVFGTANVYPFVMIVMIPGVFN
jgi:hypothetical protein